MHAIATAAVVAGQFLAAMAILSGVALAQDPPPEIAIAIKRAEWLNEECREGPGDDPASRNFCDVRDRAYARLKEQAWRLGKPGDAEYQKTWQRCPSVPWEPSRQTASTSAKKCGWLPKPPTAKAM